MGRNVKWSKKLAFDWPNQPKALEALGNRAADMLDHRINIEGRDANGEPLPKLQGKSWLLMEKSDPRAIARGPDVEPRRQAGVKGGPVKLVDRRGYADAKKAAGGKPWKGSSLTGAMWKSLTIRQKGAAGKIVLNLYFAGSSKVGGGRFRNRDKARLLQYADRASGQGFEPAGKRQFVLMAFSARETRALAQFWLTQCRLFKPA